MKTLVIEDVVKDYGGALALKRVSFSAHAGEVVALCGENGAGKSTLMAILSGARPPTSGRILIDGQAVNIENPHHAFTLGIRTVYQELSLLPPLSVTENLLLGELPTRNGRIDWPAAHREAVQRLAALGMTDIDVRRPVASYSLALQQMIEIAKAIVRNPQLLILDEPTGVLTERETRLLFERIRELRSRDRIIIYISHRLDEVFEIADRVVVLKDGAVADIMTRAEATQRRLVKAMVGRPIDAIYPTIGDPQPRVAFRAAGMAARDKFEDVAFDVKAGEIVGFFGLLGSGRTDVMRHIFGAAALDGGTMEVDGAPFAPASPGDAIAAGLAFVTEDRKRDGLLLQADVLENAGLAAMNRASWGPVLRRAQRRKMVGDKVRQLDIRPPRLDHLLRHMSGGNQQKVVLAKWLLIRGMKLLILDEPTRGVDIATKVAIYGLIAELAAQGVAIILVSSELPELLGLSHRINVMHEGRLVARFARADANESNVFAAAANLQLEAA